MSVNVLRQLQDLRQRVERLERLPSKRGVLPSKVKAAAYCGRSDEWFRRHERNGTGPEDLHYDTLDRWLRALGEDASPRPVEPADVPADPVRGAHEVAPNVALDRPMHRRALRARANQAAAE